MLKPGQEVKDKISGFTGIMTSRTEFVFGCVRCGVTSKTKKTKDGEPLNITFDEDALVVIGKGVKRVAPKSKPTTGGALDYDPRRKDVIR